MKYALLIGAALTCISAATISAHAADIPAAAPIMKAPAIAPAPNWTGSYLGLHAGAIRGKTFWQDGADDPLHEFSDTAAILGATAGYNWQAASPWVFGWEADYSWSNLHAVTGDSPQFNCVGGCTAQIDGVATLRARAGYAAGTALYYVTGGAAYGWLSAHLIGSTSVPGGKDYTKWGWTAGAGVEAMLPGNWSVKAEYLYLDFGRETDICCLDVGGDNGSSEYFRAHVFRVGLNYRFATGKAPVLGKTPAPVVTKY